MTMVFFVVPDFVSSDLRDDFVRRGLMLGQAMFVQGEELWQDRLTASKDKLFARLAGPIII